MSNNVELIYNPYKNESKITINGNTVSLYGEISNYLKEPFSKWYMKILNIVERELNDDFSITFISGLIETEIMRMMAQKSEDCVGFTAKSFSFDESIYDRAKKLSDELFKTGFLPQSGPICNCNLFYDTDETLELLYRGFNGTSIYKQSGDKTYEIATAQFYNVLCNLKKFDEAVQQCENELNIYITTSLDARILPRDNSTNIVLCLSEETRAVQIQNNDYLFNVEKNRIFDFILEVIGFIFVCPCFVQAYTYFKQIQGESISENIKLLNAIEPTITVSCDQRTLEVGGQCNLIVKTIPTNAIAPDYDVKISNQNVLSYFNGKICALSQGTALVEVCLKGTIEPIFSANLTVVQLNRIQSIDVCERVWNLSPNTQQKLEFTYSPRDATDASEIKYNSSDPLVATVDSFGVVKTLSPGKCDITISSACASAVIEVNVKPAIKSISLSSDSITMLVGQEKELFYTVWPLDTIDKNVVFTISDESIIQYDGRNVRAKSFGNAKITFTQPSTGIVSECNIEVKSTLNEKSKPNFFKILSFIFFVASLVLMVNPPVNIIVAMVGILSGTLSIWYENKIVEGRYTMFGAPKKPQIVGCIISIILNIIAIVVSTMA